MTTSAFPVAKSSPAYAWVFLAVFTEPEKFSGLPRIRWGVWWRTWYYIVTIHSRPVGMTSQAGISPLPDRV